MQGYLIHVLEFRDDAHTRLMYHYQYGYTDKAKAIAAAQLRWERFQPMMKRLSEIQINSHKIPNDTSPDELVDALVEAEMDEGVPNCIWSSPI